MTRYTIITVISLCITLMLTTAALAQGTAAGPSTAHIAEPGGVAYAGGVFDPINGPGPYPIDLDPAGLPWRKTINVDPTSNFIGSGSFTMIETVQNVGNEPWYDWHEDVFSGALGVAWNSVMSVTVNGNPIVFNQTITGINLTIDSFSQPVLPGDVMVIEKDLITTVNVVGPGQTLFQILEYPTPEPGSAALMTLGLGMFGRPRIRRSV
jgi:hypothetical protein